jgi:hypothetical protein
MGKEPKGDEHRLIIFCNEDMTPLEGVELSICSRGEARRKTWGGGGPEMHGPRRANGLATS